MSASFRMVRNSAATMGAQLLAQALRAVFVILVARYLSEADFGFYSFAQAICLILTILATMGMETIVVREIASLPDDHATRRERGRTLLGSMLTYEAFLSILVQAIAFTIAYLYGYRGERLAAFLLLGAGLTFRQLADSLMGILRGHEHMEYEVVFGLVEGLGLVGLILLFQGLGLGFMGIFYAFALTYVLQFLIGLGFVARVFFVPSFSRIHRDLDLLGKSFPVGVARITMSFSTNSGPMLLPILRTEVEAGIYGAAYQPLKGLFLFTRSLGIGMLPVFSQLYSTGDESTLESSAAGGLRLTTMLVLPMAVGLFAYPNVVLNILYGDKYGDGAVVLRVLSLVIVMTFLEVILNNLLVAMHRQRIVGIGRVVSTVLSLGLLLALTPTLGALGPAIALLGGEVLVFGLYCAVLISHYRRFPLWKALARPLVASLCMGAVLWVGRDQSLWLMVPVGLAVYLGVLILVRGVVRSDLETLRAGWHKVRQMVRQRALAARGRH